MYIYSVEHMFSLMYFIRDLRGGNMKEGITIFFWLLHCNINTGEILVILDRYIIKLTIA